MGLLSVLGGVAGNFFLPGAGGAIGSALGGALEESSGGGASGAASSAAGAANAAAERDIALRTRMYEEGITRQQPYSDVGLEFTNKLAAMQRGQTSGADMLNMDPGYGFRLSEGRKALAHKFGARGGLVSGTSLKGLQDYAQSSASQEFGNAYDRMSKLAALGPSAAGVQNRLGETYASGAGPQMYNQGVNTGNALIAANQARETSYGNLGSALSKYLSKGYNADTTGGTGIVGYGMYDGAVQGGQFGSA